MIFSDRRLLFQLLVFEGEADAADLARALAGSGFESTLYAQVGNPHGWGLLTWSEDPGFFTGALRDFLRQAPFAGMALNPAYTMTGRTYALGYETDLDETLVNRPRRRALDPTFPWAVWYPLKRKPSFYRMDPKEQREILSEHGRIGFSFGSANYGHDIRLASFGLDAHDNDFTVALVGPDLVPLSIIVETMRKTVQTSMHMEHMGPFFVGRVVHQSPLEA